MTGQNQTGPDRTGPDRTGQDATAEDATRRDPNRTDPTSYAIKCKVRLTPKDEHATAHYVYVLRPA